MKKTYTYIIYMTPQVKKFSGILGEIDLHIVSLLLAGGRTIIEEQYDGQDPVGLYSNTLKDQGMQIVNTKRQIIKGKSYIWIEVLYDPSQITPLNGQETTEELVWKQFYYPCKSGTKEECLGLMVPAKEVLLNQDKKHPIHLAPLLDALTGPKELVL
jgi:hypothetical protein